jgi:WD40 repeat protein
MLDDAMHFMQRFQKPIRRRAAHIYISAIPLTSPISLLYKTYAHTLRDIPRLISGALIHPTAINFQGIMAFSSHHSHFVLAHDDYTLWIWDVVTCTPIVGPLIGHQSPIYIIRFSDDGKNFCSLDMDSHVLVWDAVTYKMVGALPHQLDMRIFEFGIVGDRVISFAETSGPQDPHTIEWNRVIARPTDRICIWDFSRGSLVTSYELGNDEFVYFKDSYLVWRLRPSWDLDDCIRKFVHAMTGEDVTNKYIHDGQTISEIYGSPNHARLACAYHDNFLRILDADSGDIVGDPVPFEFRSGCVSFSSTGTRLVLATVHAISIYDSNTGQLLHGPLHGAYDSVSGVDLSPDETRLVVWRRSNAQHNIFMVLDVKHANVIAITKENCVAVGCTISRDGSSIIALQYGGATLFNIESMLTDSEEVFVISVTPSPMRRQLLFTFSDNTVRLSDAHMNVSSSFLLNGARPPAAFSTDGSTIVSAFPDHTLQLWDSKNANPVGKPFQGHCSTITAVSFSPEGAQLISASDDGTIFIWNLASRVGHSLQSQASCDVIKSISLSSDESRIICASKDGIIQSLDVRIGATVAPPSLYNDWQWAQFSPDGNQITCLSESGRWRSIDGHTGRVVEQSSLRHTRDIRQAAFSSKSTQFLAACKTSVIDFSDMNPDMNPDVPPTSQMAFSSDGKWVVSVHFGDPIFRICVWNSQSESLVREVWQSSYVSVAISHSGNRVLTYNFHSFQVRNAFLQIIVAHSWTLRDWSMSITFSPDEKQIICTCESGTVETWDIESGNMVNSSEDTSIVTVPPSPSPTPGMCDTCFRVPII